MERLLERLLCLAALSCCLSSASIHSLPFLSLNTSEVVNMTATNTDSNGFSPAISLPSPLPLGSRTVSSAYVRKVVSQCMTFTIIISKSAISYSGNYFRLIYNYIFFLTVASVIIDYMLAST